MIRPATLMTVLVAAQVTLGALTVLTRRDAWINSFHVVCGALVLTTSLVLTLRAWRVRFSDSTVRLMADAPADSALGVRLPRATAPGRQPDRPTSGARA